MAETNTAAMQVDSSSSRHLPVRRLAAKFVATWHTLLRDLFHSYRPERHYMRGPGPKWREKHPA